MSKTPKRPRDPNRLAKLVVGIATGDASGTDSNRDDDTDTDGGSRDELKAGQALKNPHAVALSKLGAAKGGAARAKSLTAERRREIARTAAKKRWKKKD